MKYHINFFKFAALVTTVTLSVFLSSCEDDDPPLPDNLVQFESAELGMDSDEDEIVIRVNLSREVTSATTVTLEAILTGVANETDFVTVPALSGTTLTIPIAQGATSASITLTKQENVLLDGDEKIVFNVVSVGDALTIGEKKSVVLNFSEILASQSTLDPTVGGQLQPNKVFVDLSANRQIYFNRGDWDLGFYTVEGQFKVILNSSTAMMARALDKSNLNDVTGADTVDWKNQLSTEAVFAGLTSEAPPAWLSESGKWIDAPTGDLAATAIAEISMTASDNKVYIVNRGRNPDGSQRGWKKIRVIRNGNNYVLQHADISATNFTTVEITRDDQYLFNYVQFEAGSVTIEPKRDKWDLAFTVFTNTTPAGPGLVVPYVFNDVVLQNRYGTETAELLVSNVGSYAEFDEADLTAVTFSTSQINIGSKWRSGGGPNSGPALKEDRFYIVKDAAGNIYKLKFTALTQNGERGRPQIQFELLKKGS